MSRSTKKTNHKSVKGGIFKRHIGAVISTVSIVIASGAFIGGHFAYKIGHEHGQVEEQTTDRIKVDPASSDYITPIVPKLEQDGSVTCPVNVDKTKVIPKLIDNVKVSIGTTLLVEDREYTVQKIYDNASQKCRECKVNIKSAAIKKYDKGSIFIAPELKTETFNVVFKYQVNETGEFNTFKTEVIEANKNAIKPESPINPGYSLKHWSEQQKGTAFDFSTPISKDITLYAVWENAPTYLNVTFNYNDKADETQCEKQIIQVKKDEPVQQPLTPIRSGYVFDGWYTQKSCEIQYKYNFTTKVNADLTLYAKWNNNYLKYETTGTAPNIETTVKINGSGPEICPENVVIDTEKNVTTIPTGAFKDCGKSDSPTIHQMKSINIPGTVKSIQSNAFENCGTLKYLSFADTQSNWTVKGSDTVYGWVPSINAEENATFLIAHCDCTFTRNNSTLKINATSQNLDINKEEGYAISATPEGGGEALKGVIFESTKTDIVTCGKDASGNDIIIPKKVGVAEIKAKYEGYPVASINVEVASYDGIEFESYDKVKVKAESKATLESLDIPNNYYDENGAAHEITGIAEGGFEGCTKLKKVKISKGITVIPKDAFNGSSLSESFTYDDECNVLSIGENAFKGTSISSFTIPNTVISLNPGAFANCNSLSAINFESNSRLLTIDDGCFAGSALGSITIPKTVTYIGAGAFSNCNSLTTLKVEDGNSKYYSSEDSAIIEKSSNTLIVGCNKADITIANTVTSIADSVYKDNSSIKSVIIPSSVTKIGSEAFSESSLQTVKIQADSNSKTSIGEKAFYNCTSLTSLTISEGVETIGDKAFYGCGGLTSITLPSTLTSIGVSAFEGCEKLKTITFTAPTVPGTIPEEYVYPRLTICKDAFKGCMSHSTVTEDVTLTFTPNIETIESGAFSGCTKLKTLVFETKEIEIKGAKSYYGIITIGDNAFKSTDVVKISIPRTLENFSLTAYSGCPVTSIEVNSDNSKYQSDNNKKALIQKSNKALVYAITSEAETTVPAGVEIINEKVYYGSDITKINIGNDVLIIGSQAFDGCEKLTSANIGSGVVSIQDNSFNGCKILENVTIDSPKLAKMENPGGLFTMFYKVSTGTQLKKIIKVPTGTVVGSLLGDTTKFTYSTETGYDVYTQNSFPEPEPSYTELI